MGDRAEPYASGLRFLGKPCQLLPSAPQEFCGLYENPYHPGWLSIFMIFYYDVILVYCNYVVSPKFLLKLQVLILLCASLTKPFESSCCNIRTAFPRQGL